MTNKKAITVAKSVVPKLLGYGHHILVVFASFCLRTRNSSSVGGTYVHMARTFSAPINSPSFPTPIRGVGNQLLGYTPTTLGLCNKDVIAGLEFFGSIEEIHFRESIGI